MPVQLRIAPSLGELEGDPYKVWNCKPYENQDDPSCFFGLYGLPDFYALWRHKGKKWIMWTGSDITHFINGYWLDGHGFIRLNNQWPLAKWINEHCESWVENGREVELLKSWGINTQICPSFMGNIEDYEVSYQWSGKPRMYSSVSGDNFKLYGCDWISENAAKYPAIEFHVYGNTNWPYKKVKNVIVHGRVSKEQMNAEIKQMQGGFRPLSMDGFSEILAKSILWGQWPVSWIDYPHINVGNINGLTVFPKEPNLAGREYYQKKINNFPWVQNNK